MALTSCQTRAFNAAMNTENHLTISGPAGSGKTFLMKSILQSLENKHKKSVIVAPTHQAKNVLTNMTGYQCETIHKILRIHPDTYEDQRVFKQSGEVELDDIDYFIIEESSMIDDELFNITLDLLPRKTKIIGIGDKFQLQPVKHEPGVISPMFTKFDVVEMNQVVRQAEDNPIIQVATDIRNGGWLKTNWSKELKQGVMNVKDVTKMLDVYLSKIKTPEDLLDYRILAYTNDSVNTFNDIIRENVYKTNESFVVGEYVVVQQPVMKSMGKYAETVVENGEVVLIKGIRQDIIDGGLPRVDAETFDVAVLTVEKQDGTLIEFTSLWDEAQRERFERYLLVAAGTYKSMRENTKIYWRAFWSLKEQMIETKSLGASTIHKSQGSTVKGTCLYTSDMSFAEPEIMQQLAYVGVTRATDWVLYH